MWSTSRGSSREVRCGSRLPGRRAHLRNSNCRCRPHRSTDRGNLHAQGSGIVRHLVVLVRRLPPVPATSSPSSVANEKAEYQLFIVVPGCLREHLLGREPDHLDRHRITSDRCCAGCRSSRLHRAVGADDQAFDGRDHIAALRSRGCRRGIPIRPRRPRSRRGPPPANAVPLTPIDVTFSPAMRVVEDRGRLIPADRVKW